jgi:hypothetical protein
MAVVGTDNEIFLTRVGKVLICQRIRAAFKSLGAIGLVLSHTRARHAGMGARRLRHSRF